MLSIPVWRYAKSGNKILDILNKAIVYFTGSAYTHVGLYFKGYLYEHAIWENNKKKLVSGIRVTSALDPAIPSPSFCMAPNYAPSYRLERIEEALSSYHQYLEPKQVQGIPVLLFIWYTRWFWKKIGWVPFHCNLYGVASASFVDRVMMKAQFDLFPEDYKNGMVPGQFVSLIGWHSERVAYYKDYDGKRGPDEIT